MKKLQNTKGQNKSTIITSKQKCQRPNSHANWQAKILHCTTNQHHQKEILTETDKEDTKTNILKNKENRNTSTNTAKKTRNAKQREKQGTREYMR